MSTNIDISGMLAPCRATYQYEDCHIQIRYDAYRPDQIIQYRFIDTDGTICAWQLMPFRVSDLGNKSALKALSLFKAYNYDTQA